MSEGAAPPDVLGLTLPEAVDRLEAEGWRVVGSQWVGPPDRPTVEVPPGRVVRVRPAGDRAVSLTYVSTRSLPE